MHPGNHLKTGPKGRSEAPAGKTSISFWDAILWLKVTLCRILWCSWQQSWLKACYLCFMSQKTLFWNGFKNSVARPGHVTQYYIQSIQWNGHVLLDIVQVPPLWQSTMWLLISQLCLFPLEDSLTYPHMCTTKCHCEYWICVHGSSWESWAKFHLRAFWLVDTLWSLAWT